MKKIPDFWKNVELPEFLYVDEGEIKIGFHGDCICTEEWEEWFRRIHEIIVESKLKGHLL